MSGRENAEGTTDWYEQAWVYDLAFAFEPAHEVAIIDEAMRSAGIAPPARLLEPMVGTGRLLPGLVALGYRPTGYDRSRAMVLRARERVGPDLPLFVADATHTSLGRAFDGAFCLIDSFRYLTAPGDAERFFDATMASLRPGGIFLLGLEIEGSEPPAEETWHVHRDGLEVEVTVRNRGRPGPGLRWMESEVSISGGEDGPREFRSRRAQKVWTADAFERFLDTRPATSITGLWLRTLDLESPLQNLPRSGGSIILRCQHD